MRHFEFEHQNSLFMMTYRHRAAVLHASAVCQFEPSIAWTSLRGHGPPLAQGGSGHGLHLHSVFDFPSTKVVQMDAQAEARAPDNATAWQPSVFDCGRQPLLLSGYFQHVKCVSHCCVSEFLQ